MSTEVRYDSGPFPSSSSDDQWMLLSVWVDGQATRHHVVRTAPRTAHAVFDAQDPFWWCVARAGADRLHSDDLDGRRTPDAFEVSAAEVRRALTEGATHTEALIGDETVLRRWQTRPMADDQREQSRASSPLPEEQAAGDENPTAQATAILADSDERQADRNAAPGSVVEHRTSDEATPPVE